jgi:IclR family mhp operon transcriptional activator
MTLSQVRDTEQQRGTLRTLAVLRTLNENTRSTVSELSKTTGIPRPSLYRILETMRAAGYVRRAVDDGRYQLTSLIRSLSYGFEEYAWIKDVATPLLHELQREILWPTDLADSVGDAMYLRETTRRASPLAIDHRAPGLRVPMLVSASGRAYLAYCPDSEREEILRILRQSQNPHDAVARNRRSVARILMSTRANGYGQRFGENFMRETGSIAIPIRTRKRLIACLNITFIASAITPRQAADRYLAAMRRTASAIAAGVDHL